MSIEGSRLHSLKWKGIILVCTLWICTSCADDTQYRLTASERTKADTIFLAQIDSLNRFADSLCTLLNDTKLQEAIDSIIALRKGEAEALKKRNQTSDQLD